MKKKLSNAAKRSLIAESLRVDVMTLLNWNSLEYGNFKFEQGLLYLETYLSDYNQHIQKEWVSKLSASPVYWSWWKNHWTIRDEQFFNELCTCSTLNSHVYEYKKIHDGKALASSIQPNRTILEESYPYMISNLILDEQLK